MSKITVNPVADLTQTSTAQTTINTGFSTIQTAFDNTLSRDGTQPNTMGANLDMNSNQIINLPAPSTVNSPARLIDITTPIAVPSAILSSNNVFTGTNSFTNTVTIPNNTITNAEIAQSPATTLKGNNTGSTANVADLTVSQVSGMFPTLFQAGGRLTLASLTPVLANSSRAAQTTIYYTPYKSQVVPLFDGINMIMTDTGGELSQLTTDTTKSPAAVVASSNYDIFVWNDAGTIRATRGPAWTNNITRSNNLIFIKGVPLNTSSITNGPAAQRGTYVGTVASNATSTIDFIFGGSASGGSAASFGVWNYWNRVTVGTFNFDNGASYTYTSNTTRQARGSAGNQISFVCGVSEDSVVVWSQAFITTVAVAGAGPVLGIGFDSNTVFGTGTLVRASSANALTAAGSTFWTAQSQIGFHTYSRVEQGDNTNANNFAIFGGDQLSFSFPM